VAENPYGAEHQRRREELLPKAIGTLCPRCGETMFETDDLDLGHSEDLAINPHAVGDRIEHADCNRAAGARLGNALKARETRYAPSREW